MEQKPLAWINRTIGSKRVYLVFLTLVQSLNSASGVFYAVILKELVDSAAKGDADGFWCYVIYGVLLVAFQITIRAVNRWLMELSRASFENAFKARQLDALLGRDLSQVSGVHSAEWLNRLTNDTVVVSQGLVDILPGVASMVVKLISALVMMATLEPRFTAILIPLGLVLIVVSWLFRKVLKRYHKSVQEADGRLRVFLQERISSLMVIHSYGAEGYVKGQAAERMEEHKKERMRRNHFSNLPNIGFAVIMNGLSLFAACWCGYGILKGTMSFGTLTAVTQLVAQIQMPFANISGFVPRYYSMIASAERLMEAERFEEDMADEAVAEPGTFYDSLAAIGLENVSYSYADRADGAGSEAAVKDLSFEVKKGSWVAFTGHSGCGKTTALKLLMCILKPQSGLRYYKDGSTEKLPLDAKWRSLFAYVPQGNQLMNGTIREVVSLADPDAAADDARVQKALQLACADEFVSQLEDGADTMLGERGCGLSEGQMQRIAIARALFSERPIILLDEATASLDAATERRVLENIKALPGKTVIIVTHRSAALDYCDQVISFE